MTFPELAQKAINFHERECQRAASLWLEGLNVMLRGFDVLHGGKSDGESQMVMLALLFGAWNSINCARDLALRGYQLQALNLLRLPVEYWMAFWYLRNFPEEHHKFLAREKPEDQPPSFNEMLQALEAKHQREKGTA